MYQLPAVESEVNSPGYDFAYDLEGNDSTMQLVDTQDWNLILIDVVYE